MPDITELAGRSENYLGRFLRLAYGELLKHKWHLLHDKGGGSNARKEKAVHLQEQIEAVLEELQARLELNETDGDEQELHGRLEEGKVAAVLQELVAWAKRDKTKAALQAVLEKLKGRLELGEGDVVLAQLLRRLAHGKKEKKACRRVLADHEARVAAFERRGLAPFVFDPDDPSLPQGMASAALLRDLARGVKLEIARSRRIAEAPDLHHIECDPNLGTALVGYIPSSGHCLHVGRGFAGQHDRVDRRRVSEAQSRLDRAKNELRQARSARAQTRIERAEKALANAELHFKMQLAREKAHSRRLTSVTCALLGTFDDSGVPAPVKRPFKSARPNRHKTAIRPMERKHAIVRFCKAHGARHTHRRPIEPFSSALCDFDGTYCKDPNNALSRVFVCSCKRCREANGGPRDRDNHSGRAIHVHNLLRIDAMVQDARALRDDVLRETHSAKNTKNDEKNNKNSKQQQQRAPERLVQSGGQATRHPLHAPSMQA